MSLKASDLSFGEFVLDPVEKTLRRNGKPVSLPPKALHLLFVLVENPGRIVEKDILIDRVWPDTFVEEGNLPYTVRLLRKALDDDAESPRFIETIPRRGYRFIGDLNRAESPEGTETKVSGDESVDHVSNGESTSGTVLHGVVDHLATTEPSEQQQDVQTGELEQAAADSRAAGVRTGRPPFGPRIIATIALITVLGVGLSYYYFSRYNAPAGNKTSLVVIPFVNESGNSEFDYLSDGISESLINSLSELRQLKVVARGTAFTYKNRQIHPQDIGRELNVDTILTGKVSQFGDALIVQADLLDVEDGSQLWGDRYTLVLADLPSIPQKISREIVRRLYPRLEGEISKEVEDRFSRNSEAYQLDLKGRFFWNRRTEEGLQKGVGYFEQAIAEDPGYALAYVGLADSFNVMGFYTFLPPEESFPKAKVAAGKALELNEDLAEAYNSLAYANLYYDWDFVAAEKGFRRAIELKPNYSVAHQWYGNLLTAEGRWEEALESFKRAGDLDPLSPVITAVPAWTYFYARQYDKAIEPCRRAIELDPNFALAHTWLGQAYERKGDYEKALAEFKKALEASKGSPEITALLAHAYAVSGDRKQSQIMLDELVERSKHRYVSPYHIATVFAGLGDKESALQWLERAFEDRQHVLIFLNYDSRLDDLRSDRRFQDLAQRVRRQ